MYRTVEPWRRDDGEHQHPDRSIRRNYGEAPTGESVGMDMEACHRRSGIGVRRIDDHPPDLNLRVLADGEGSADVWRTSVPHISRMHNFNGERSLLGLPLRGSGDAQMKVRIAYGERAYHGSGAWYWMVLAEGEFPGRIIAESKPHYKTIDEAREAAKECADSMVEEIADKRTKTRGLAGA